MFFSLSMSSRLCATNILLLASTAAGLNGGIDTHFHVLPSAYVNALTSAGGDPSGYPTPTWSIDGAIGSLNMTNSSIGILSVSSPGVPIVGHGKKGQKLARSLNKYLGSFSCDKRYKDRIGFFGVLPDWQDVNVKLAEIDYLHGKQKLCNGVTVYTTYGNKLLGHSKFKPIWKKLQSYKALVFIHPGLLDISPKFISTGIPQPVIDYPLATTRTAVDLVMTGTLRSCPDIDVILSHAGGTLPFLGSRAIGSLVIPAIASKASVNYSQAIEDFSRFYYDIALSTSPAQLDGLLDYTKPGKVLFGSDYPYAPPIAITAALSGYASYIEENTRGRLIDPAVLRNNSLTLLNKHSQGRKLPELIN